MLKLRHLVLICGFNSEEEAALRSALPSQADPQTVSTEDLSGLVSRGGVSMAIVKTAEIARQLQTLEAYPLIVAAEETDGIFATLDARPLSNRLILSRALEYAEMCAENRSLQQDWKQVAGEIESVFEFGRSSESERDVTLTLDRLAGSVCRSFGYSACAIELIDQNTWELYIKASYGFPPEARAQKLPIEGSGIVSYVARTGKPVYIEDITKDERYLRVNASTRSQLALPLRVGQEIIGVLNIESERLSGFTQRDIFIMTSFAEKVSGLVHQAHLFDLVSRAKSEWESTFDAMADAVFIFDRKRRLRRINRAGAELMGSNFERLLGQYCCTLFPDEEHTGCLAQRVFAQGQRLVDKQLFGPDQIPAILTSEPIYSDSRQIIGCVTIIRSQTESIKGEAEARNQRDMLATLLENSSSAIIYLEPDGRISWYNMRSLELFCCNGGELNKTHFDQLAPEEYRPQLRRIISKLSTGPCSFETVFTHGSSTRPVAVTSSPVISEGQYTGALLILQELTDRAERAAENDRLRALGQLSSGVAHDFNNILAAILGRAQLMQKRVNDPELIKNLQVIERAARDGARMAKRILDFGKPRNSKENYAPIEVGELISEALAVTAPRWKDEANRIGHRIDVQFEPTLAVTVLGDGSELREVLTNLIMNSIDALPEGGKIEIDYGIEGKSCYICVTDTGTGIPAELKESIFEPFFTTKGEHGTGLGLHLVQNILLDHGGSIQVESEVGSGTCMKIILPLADTPTGSQRIRQMIVEQQPSARILVVDDEEDVLEILADILGSFGHEVTTTNSPENALGMIEREQFELLVTDLGMPRINGIQLARRARELRPEVQVILCTGWGEESQMDLNGTVDTVIGKPFDLDNISAALRVVLMGEKR